MTGIYFDVVRCIHTETEHTENDPDPEPQPYQCHTSRSPFGMKTHPKALALPVMCEI